ncbi:MAG: sel1 repeat family protein [Ruminococcaceae bacterium]|nr:sel1 repeat family protein [Oscillospiraceae bacterium]
MDREIQETVEMILNAQKPMMESSFEDTEIDIDDLIDVAESGDSDAQGSVGLLYLYGIQVHRNYEKAAKWLEKSARQGNAGSEFQLGLCYSIGMGVEEDLDEAIRWVRRSVKHGFTEGMPFLIILESCYD